MKPLPEDAKLNPSISAEIAAINNMMERLQHHFAEIIAPLVEYQLAIAESIREQIPERFFKFQELVRRTMEMWNEYIRSCRQNIDNDIFTTPFYPTYNLEPAKSVDMIDVNHSNSPPKDFSLREQAIENLKLNLNEYSQSKLWKHVKHEFPELIRAVIHQLILNWLFR